MAWIIKAWVFPESLNPVKAVIQLQHRLCYYCIHRGLHTKRCDPASLLPLPCGQYSAITKPTWQYFPELNLMQRSTNSKRILVRNNSFLPSLYKATGKHAFLSWLAQRRYFSKNKHATMLQRNNIFTSFRYITGKISVRMLPVSLCKKTTIRNDVFPIFQLEGSKDRL